MMDICSCPTLTNDQVIRSALLHQLSLENPNKRDSIIIPELGLKRGISRIDVAVVNGILHGYEIKSDLDTFSRLPDQMSVYNSIFDKITIVVGKKHLLKAVYEVPEWWGITLAKHDLSKIIKLLPIREPNSNPYQDTHAIAELLWKDELLKILKEKNAAAGFKSKTKKIISDKLINIVTQQELKNLIRENMKKRYFMGGWRSDLQSMLYDD